MPVLRVTYTRPDASLPPAHDLGGRLTEVVLRHHELSRWADQLRSMFRVRMHEMPCDRFLLGGQVSPRALYDIEYIIPAGTLSETVRDAVADGMTRAVLEWEGVAWDPDEAMRVMLVVTEVAHDRWFWGGRPVTPRTIIEFLGRLRRGARRVAGEAIAKASEPA